MGTDIHGTLEYRRQETWSGLDDGWSLARNYYLFSLLANVRGKDALYSPRGFPRDAADNASEQYWVVVAENQEEASRHPNWVPRARAESAVAAGHAEWQDATQRLVSDGQWHTPSWLTTGELRHILNRYDATVARYYAARRAEEAARTERPAPAYETMLAGWDNPPDLHPDWRILLGAMEAGEARGIPMRFIFWFDN